MGIATIFGTLVLTNLLIALMTTEYEKVSERAAAEVMCNQAELAYDLTTQTSRLMPAPLNLIPLVFSVIIWFFNLIISLLNPRFVGRSYMEF